MIKYIYAFSALILSLAYCKPATAQEWPGIAVVGGTLNNNGRVFVGETHINKIRPEFNPAIINYVHEHNGISNIVFEYGQSLAYLCNLYLDVGDTTIYLYRGPQFRKFLAECRSKNQSLPTKKQFRFYGIDFERMEFAKALLIILNKEEHAKNTRLYAFLKSIPDSVCQYINLGGEQSRVRKELYATARGIFEREQDTLRAILTTDFGTVERILTNPAMEKHMGLRDKWMSVNLQRQLGDQKFICVIGEMHTNMRYRSAMLSKYLRQTDNTGVALITQVCTFTSINETLGPKYIARNDSLLAFAYRQSRQGVFTLLQHDIFKNYTNAGTHGVDNYYIFSTQESMSAD